MAQCKSARALPSSRGSWKFHRSAIPVRPGPTPRPAWRLSSNPVDDYLAPRRTSSAPHPPPVRVHRRPRQRSVLVSLLSMIGTYVIAFGALALAGSGAGAQVITASILLAGSIVLFLWS